MYIIWRFACIGLLPCPNGAASPYFEPITPEGASYRSVLLGVADESIPFEEALT
jgi:hypothetical protein